MEGKLADEEVLRHIPKDTRSRESNDEEALAEARHFEEVCRALKSYGRFAGEDIDRMERHLSNLHPDEKALLIQPIPERYCNISPLIAH
ncbi:hypothetical protein GNI_121220 [Gregarina niphandrodes]|uniref:Uncharacterized protein n=1 Tax=Gregarina niphandrodes TaxID=110365 RepID=A0A023B2Z4_GRENI|nr:hypothetical protein GNI_121220 [Gregarina niphandrodes]EZG53807.1 hypothetical protein GNI_121220 [Gregarina niphandrodes]|eukprot:XP_011131858.1 hypothetical protein GNI_121220 [Gregarina niphandrodes]